MFKLMKLEIRKFRLNRYLLHVIVINMVLIGMLSVMNLVYSQEIEIDLHFWSSQFILIEALIKAVFIVFAAILIAKLIISEYIKNTMSIMFMYPISRKKIIASKLLLIVIFTVIAMLVSQIIISLAVILLNHLFGFIEEDLTGETVRNTVKLFFQSTVFTAGICMIPLFFGMWKKSILYTIISGVVLMFFLSANNGMISIFSITPIPLILALSGIFVAYLTIGSVEHADI